VALARRYGLPADPGLRRMFGHLYIHRKPRILDFPYGCPLAREVRDRPSMFDRRRPPAPDCLSGLDERPLVHLSLGTTFATTPAGRAVLSLAMRALATEPVNLVVSTGPVAPGEFDPVPDNVRLVSYVDHEALLPRCALFLSHGSFSSILVSIAAGVPMCFLPLSADQPVVSMHLANLGLGVNLANVPQPPVARLDPATLREQDVRAAVRRVLDDDRYRRTVAAVRDAFLALPGLDAVMSRIGDLPSDGRQ